MHGLAPTACPPALVRWGVVALALDPAQRALAEHGPRRRRVRAHRPAAAHQQRASTDLVERMAAQLSRSPHNIRHAGYAVLQGLSGLHGCIA